MADTAGAANPNSRLLAIAMARDRTTNAVRDYYIWTLTGL
jgi:hypothetical protein